MDRLLDAPARHSLLAAFGSALTMVLAMVWPVSAWSQAADFVQGRSLFGESLTTGICSGCHGAPPNVGSALITNSITGSIDRFASVTDLRDAMVNNGGMGSLVNAGNRYGLLPTGGFNNSDELTKIMNYLHLYRDGGFSTSNTAFSAQIGSSTAAIKVVSLTNYRTVSYKYTLSQTTVDAFENAGFYIASESCPGRVIPSDQTSCDIYFRFEPKSIADVSVDVEIGLTDTIAHQQAPYKFKLTGVGLSVPAPSIAPATSLITLASVDGSKPVVTSYQLTNNSTQVPLKVSSITSNDAVHFAVTPLISGDCLPAPNGSATFDLAPSGSCRLVLAFDPKGADGPFNATLSIHHNASNSPLTVGLTGTTSKTPVAVMQWSSTDPIALGDAVVHVPSAPATVVVTNVASDPMAPPLRFKSITVVGGNAPSDFQLGGSCKGLTELKRGERCTLEVVFTPGALGPRDGRIVFVTTGTLPGTTERTDELKVSGVGTPVPAPKLVIDPVSVLAFGDQTLGGLYAPREVKLTNTGDAVLQIQSITSDAAAFVVETTSDCGRTLAAHGGSCTVRVRFQPTSAGADASANLRVVSDSAGSPHTVALQGRGVAQAVPVLAWASGLSLLDLGNVSAGAESSPQTLTLLNQGPGGLTLGLLNVIGADATAFGLVNSSTAGHCRPDLTLYQGDSCVVEVVFHPTQAGARTAELQVVSGSGSLAPRLRLTATGMAGPQPVASASVSALTFEDTVVGSQSLPREVILSSSGNSQLQVESLAIEGDFVLIAGTCPAPPFALVPGQSCVFRIASAPSVARASVSGTLTLTAAGLAQPLQVTLTGRGTDPPPDSGGGCSIASGGSGGRGGVDPLLALLTVGALGVLVARRRRGGRDGRR